MITTTSQPFHDRQTDTDGRARARWFLSPRWNTFTTLPRAPSPSHHHHSHRIRSPTCSCFPNTLPRPIFGSPYFPYVGGPCLFRDAYVIHPYISSLADVVSNSSCIHHPPVSTIVFTNVVFCWTLPSIQRCRIYGAGSEHIFYS